MPNIQTFPNEVISGPVLDGMELWLKGSLGITLSGSDVQAWADQSGNGNDASAPAAINRPLYVENALNGKPVLRFNGVDEWLMGSSIITAVTPRTLLVVGKVNNAVDIYIFQLSNSISTGEAYGLTMEPAVRTRSYTYICNDLASDYSIIANTFTANDLFAGTTIFMNGSELPRTDGANGTINTGTDNYLVGSFGDGMGGPGDVMFNGDIAEILVYSRALSQTEREHNELYLAVEYGIQLT